MKQYCRYCCNACLNDDEVAYTSRGPQKLPLRPQRISGSKPCFDGRNRRDRYFLAFL